MKTYEIHFIFDNRPHQELITTTNAFKAKLLIKARYPGAKITSVREV